MGGSGAALSRSGASSKPVPLAEGQEYGSTKDLARAMVNDFDADDNGAVNLYFKMRGDNYLISYNGQEGEWGPNSKKVSYRYTGSGVQITKISNLSKSAYYKLREPTQYSINR